MFFWVSFFSFVQRNVVGERLSKMISLRIKSIEMYPIHFFGNTQIVCNSTQMRNEETLRTPFDIPVIREFTYFTH